VNYLAKKVEFEIVAEKQLCFAGAEAPKKWCLNPVLRLSE
jgi:hypothetical protein